MGIYSHKLDSFDVRAGSEKMVVTEHVRRCDWHEQVIRSRGAILHEMVGFVVLGVGVGPQAWLVQNELLGQQIW
jgi:hypothetical protein